MTILPRVFLWRNKPQAKILPTNCRKQNWGSHYKWAKQDSKALAKEQAGYLLVSASTVVLYLPIPVNQQTIMATYLQIKKDIKDLVENEMERLLNDPELVTWGW